MLGCLRGPTTGVNGVHTHAFDWKYLQGPQAKPPTCSGEDSAVTIVRLFHWHALYMIFLVTGKSLAKTLANCLHCVCLHAGVLVVHLYIPA